MAVQLYLSSQLLAGEYIADDSVFFAKATCQQSNEIVSILQTYGAASGQQVNFAKFELTFSKNVERGRRVEVQQVLRIKEVEKHEKYLGLPTMLGRSKRAIFAQVKERIWKKLKGWKEKSLSKSGKEILLKSVAQAIPMYTMSCFALPVGLCREIEQLLCNFWWGDCEGKKKMHWLSWKRLCLPKNEGGMGFRDLEVFNLSLLARQGWRLLRDPCSLIARLLKAKYFPRTSFMEAEVGYAPSYVWRSILKGREALATGLLWSVGNGSNIDVWRDRWLPRPSEFRPITNPTSNDSNLRVIDLINWESGKWREESVHDLFLPCDAEVILAMRLVDPAVQDELIWFYTKDGKFTVKTAYHMLMKKRFDGDGVGQSDVSHVHSLWKKFWKIRVHPRIKNCVWRACKEILPTKANLVRRRVVEADCCFRCGAREDGMHAVFFCREARRVWKLVPELYRCGRHCKTVMEFGERVLRLLSPLLHQHWAVILCALWRARNELLFEGKALEPAVLLEEALLHHGEFLEAVTTEKGDVGRPIEGQELKWKKPDLGVIKVNCDAAVDCKGGCGIGIIARDNEGVALFIGAKRVQQTEVVELVEAEAILWAAQMVVQQEITHAVFESDCLGLVKKLQTRERPLGAMGAVLGRIWQMCGELTEYKFAYTRRQANKAAHSLALIKPEVDLFTCFETLFPSCLNLVLLEEIE